MYRLSAAVFTGVLLLCAVVYGDSVPNLINYQGKLTDSAGQPLPNGTYTLTFRIYDQAQGGTIVWGPQICDNASGPGHAAQLPLIDGYFNTMLGPIDTASRSILDAFSTSERYLEIQVAASPPMAPRQKILSAPYALLANQAGAAKSLNGAVNITPRAHYTPQFQTSSDIAVPVPNCQVTITSSGRPVVILVNAESIVNDQGAAGIRIYRDGNELCNWKAGSSSRTPISITFIDRVAAGTHQYSIYIRAQDNSGTTIIGYPYIEAYEL